MAGGVQPADLLHRIHGAREQEHVPGDTADRERTQSGGDQLGTRGRQNPNLLTVGFMGESLHRSATWCVAPRNLSHRRVAVSGGGNRIHPDADWSEGEAMRLKLVF